MIRLISEFALFAATLAVWLVILGMLAVALGANSKPPVTAGGSFLTLEKASPAPCQARNSVACQGFNG